MEYLYHGTSTQYLKSILKDGILPRGASRKSNWNSTVRSHPGTVYLTTGYALYFALQAARGVSAPAVLEIEYGGLGLSNLVCDEDALEQGFRGKDDLPEHWSMKKRTLWYRDRADQFSSQVSLTAIGTCGYRGTIPVGAIRRIAVLDPQKQAKALFTASDASISIMNYQFCGGKYRSLLNWVFNEDSRDPDGVPGDISSMLGTGDYSNYSRDGLEIHTPESFDKLI